MRKSSLDRPRGPTRRRPDRIGHYARTPANHRPFFTLCVVPVNDAGSVRPLKDALPKPGDFPAEAGGSGEVMGE